MSRRHDVWGVDCMATYQSKLRLGYCARDKTYRPFWIPVISLVDRSVWVLEKGLGCELGGGLGCQMVQTNLSVLTN